ncbi:MAG: hypothetical protein PF542_05060 [Nanoarchaeota archaeon]|jgi:hypothetical protein|nr:hypothetical protein [Nanoarchaeota archaeon]
MKYKNLLLIISVILSLLFVNVVSAACSDSISTFLHYENDFSSDSLEVTQGDMVSLVSIIYSYDGPLWMEELTVVGEPPIYTKNEPGLDQTFFHIFTSTDSLDTTNLSPGIHTINLMGSSLNSCGFESSTLTLTILAKPDTTDPTVDITYPIDGTTYTTHRTNLTLNVYDENLNSCTYSLNGAAQVSTGPVTNGINAVTGITSVEGENTWAVTCKDDSDNTATDTVTFIIEIPDTTDPILEITYPIDGVTYTSHRTNLTFDVYDENLNSCSYKLVGEQSTSAGVNQFSNGINSVTGITSQEGENTWSVTCTDVAGNNATYTITFYVEFPDTTDPIVTITYPEDGLTYTSHRTNLSFDVYDENLESCTYSLNGATSVDVLNPTNGINSVIGITSVEGENTWSVTCTDAAGNNATDIITFYVEFPDTTNPTLQITYPIDGATYDHQITQLNFSVYDENLDSCEYKINSNEWLDFFPVANGANTVTGITSLSGSNTWQVRCQDLSGNAASDSVTFIVELPDTTGPTLEITYPIDGATYTFHRTNLTFDVFDENLDYCSYMLNDGSLVIMNSATNGINNITGITSVEGENTWSVTCTDAAGNNATDIITFYVEFPDTTDPTLTITYPIDGATYTSHRTNLTFDVYDENLASCAYSLAGEQSTLAGAGPDINGLRSITGITSQEGENTWSVTCLDDAGNNATDSVTFHVEFSDTTDPIVIITNPVATTYSSYRTSMTFEVIEENLDYCEYSTDGSTYQNVSLANNGTNTINNVVSVEGSNTWSVKCYDKSNNDDSDSVTFFVKLPEVDDTDPVVTITYPENTTYTSHVTNLTFEVVEENLDYCQYSIDGITYQYVPSVNNGTNTIDNITSVEGPNNWRVRCYDLSDNKDLDSVTFTVKFPIVDDTDPVVTILYPENTTYTEYITNMTFEVIEDNLHACDYSINGASPLSVINPTNGINTITGIISVEGSNIWTVTCKDDENNTGFDSVTFIVEFEEEITNLTLTPINPTEGEEVEKEIIFKADTNKNAIVVYSLDGDANRTMIYQSNWSFISNERTFSVGDHQVIFCATDDFETICKPVNFIVKEEECEDDCETCPNRRDDENYKGRLAISSDEELPVVFINKPIVNENSEPMVISLNINKKESFLDRLANWIASGFN